VTTLCRQYLQIHHQHRVEEYTTFHLVGLCLQDAYPTRLRRSPRLPVLPAWKMP
jgi:hypothetical protein